MNKDQSDVSETVAPQMSPLYSLEAEQTVLACMLALGDEVLPTCFGTMRHFPALFHDSRHKLLTITMEGMYQRHKPIDLVTVKQRLEDNHLLDEAGGAHYLEELRLNPCHTDRLDHYLTILKDKYALRGAFEACRRFIDQVDQKADDATLLVDELERSIVHRSLQVIGTSGKSNKDLLAEMHVTMEYLSERKTPTFGVPTGFPHLDKISDGWQPGKLVVIGGQGELATAAFGYNMVEHIALTQKLPVGFFSLGLPAPNLFFRLACSVGQVNFWKVLHGPPPAEACLSKLSQAATRLATAPIYIDESVALSLVQLRARVERMWRSNGTKLLLIDDLRLLEVEPSEGGERRQPLDRIAGGLKQIARDFGLPVIVLAQLETPTSPEPLRPDLSWMGEWKTPLRHADFVGLLYQTPGTHDQDKASQSDTTPMNLFVARHRFGPTGEVPFLYSKRYARFESAGEAIVQDAVLE